MKTLYTYPIPKIDDPSFLSPHTTHYMCMHWDDWAIKAPTHPSIHPPTKTPCSHHGPTTSHNIVKGGRRNFPNSQSHKPKILMSTKDYEKPKSHVHFPRSFSFKFRKVTSCLKTQFLLSPPLALCMTDWMKWWGVCGPCAGHLPSTHKFWCVCLPICSHMWYPCEYHFS